MSSNWIDAKTKSFSSSEQMNFLDPLLEELKIFLLKSDQTLKLSLYPLYSYACRYFTQDKLPWL